MDKNFYTVSELNQFIKDVINAGFPQIVWVCGEMQQYNRSKTKRHIFFELVEKNEKTEDVQARIGLVIFENRKMHIQKVLKESKNTFELKDDIEVKFACKVDFYPPHGAIRLIVENIDPFYTLGKLALEKQKIIALLKEKGILDQNKKLPLAAVPLNIGLVTSYDSAAYNDFLSELKKSGFGFSLQLRNALMQGKNAPKDVCRALEELNQKEGLDVIVITRGGGSISDLSCFDNQQIAETIAKLKVPVFSGIGHEIDLTITDMASHTYAKTPTAIAQCLSQRVQSFVDLLDECFLKIVEGTRETIRQEKERTRHCAISLQNLTLQYLKDHREHVVRLTEGLRIKPSLLLSGQSSQLERTQEALIKVSDQFMASKKNHLKNFQKMIDIIKPENTMRRGFCITRRQTGELLKHVGDVQEGDEISTEFMDGKVVSLVNKKQKKKGG